MPARTNIDRTAFWLLLALLVCAFVWLLKPFLAPLFVAMVFALAIEPIFQFFVKLLRGWRYLAASVTMIGLLLFLALPLAALAAIATDQILKLVPTAGESFTHLLQEMRGAGVIASATEWFRQRTGIPVDVGIWAQEVVQRLSHFLYQFSPQVVAGTTQLIVMGLVSMVLTYFLLVDGPKLYHAILELSPLKEDYEQALADEIQLTVRATLYGYVMTAFVQSVLAWVGFAIARLPGAPLLALATFLLAFIPLIGTAGVWVPVCIYLFVTGQYGYGIFMLVYGVIVISGIDNVLKPLLIRGKTQIHPVLLFLAILGGLKLWGPIGVLAGPTLVAVLLATLKIYRRDFLS